MMSAAQGNNNEQRTEREVSDIDQAKLQDFMFEFPDVHRTLENLDENTEPFVTGEALVNPDYEKISFILAPEGSHEMASEHTKQQFLESNLMQRNHKESFDLVAESLNTGRALECVGPGKGIPINQDFEYGGLSYNVQKFDERKMIPKSLGDDFLLYPVSDYLAREKRPTFGKQMGLSALDNLREEDIVDFWHVISLLKSHDATVYVTGSLVASSDYNDIDIAVDASGRRPNRKSIDPVENPLPDHLSGWDLVGAALFDLTGELSKEFEVEHTLAHDYRLLENLYRIELNGTQFDIGYDEDPLRSTYPKSYNHLGADEDSKYVKL